MASIEELNVKMTHTEQDIKELKDEMKSVKNEIKEFSDLKSEIRIINTNISTLANTVNSNNISTNKSISDLVKIVEKQGQEIVNQKDRDNEFLLKFTNTVEEIKNAPAQMALKEREATRKTLKDYAIKGVIALILLGLGCYIGGLAGNKHIEEMRYEQSK